MKKILFLTSFFLLLIAQPVHAQSTAASTTAAATTQTSPTSAAVSTSNNFVPLTSIPAISQIANSTNNGLTDFFNSLYKICIGVAAALAVFKIMQAGIMYMGGDSVTETKQARAMIATSIGGLVLVLSPAIVFGIINPNILSLQIGGANGFATLAPAAVTESSSSLPNGTAPICTTPIASGAVVTSANDQACCNSQSGCKVTLAIPPGGSVLSQGSATCLCGTAAAASSASTGSACPSGSDNDCPSTQICNPDTKLCMADNNDGLFSVGDGPCSNDNECRGSTTECNMTTQKCVYAQ